jgi:arabinose-5-phosphate isomerase
MLEEARALVRAEAAALAAVAERLDEGFVEVVHLVAGCRGRIFVTGAGTSGAMAHRLAHLLGTCGMPAFSVSPGDALHGQSAIVAPGDVMIALSKAGRSADINQFAGIARHRGCTVVALTADPGSELARLSHHVVVIETDRAAEGEGVLPFGSTLAHGAFGDALCLMAKRMRGFDLAELTRTHPLGGSSRLVAGTADAPGRDDR